MSAYGDEVTDYLNNIDNHLDRVATALERLVEFLTSPPVIVVQPAGFERYTSSRDPGMVQPLPLIPVPPRDPRPSTITC